MANSAADARQSEMEIRKKLLQARAVDVMISIGRTSSTQVTLPCTLWFFDKGKGKTDRKDKVLFIDAQNTFSGRWIGHTASSVPSRLNTSPYRRLYRGEKTGVRGRGR